MRRPILDLSSLNKFLQPEEFKMETGERVNIHNFKDAYFHIPINLLSRKYLRFHVHGQSYQFKALPLGLFTAPMEFTMTVMEVKQMCKNPQAHRCLVGQKHILSNLSPSYTDTGSNVSRIRLDSKHGVIRAGTQADIRFCRFDQFDLKDGKVRPTLECWQTLKLKIQRLLIDTFYVRSDSSCPLQTF